MDQILNELQAVPGVIGAFVFHTQNGILHKELPSVFKDAKLLKIGKSLVKIYAAGCMGTSELSEISIFYEESILVVRRKSSREFLVVLLDLSANLSLVSMSLNLIMDEWAAIPEKEPLQQPERKPVAVVQQSADNNGYTPEGMLQSGPLAESLQNMQLSLAKVVGPIAKVIFRDALNDWIKTGTPSIGTVADLIDILQKEINDPEKFREYRQRIAAYLVTAN
ncbi:MAG: hypothetical protein ACOZF0_19960 [Thermodesulfobacteriota bacterium]